MKKTIKIIGIIACAAVILLNVSLNHKNSAGNIDLSKLIVTNQADAECIYDWKIPELNHGRCSSLTGNCYWDWPDYQDCDPEQGWY
jgi:hypothetical protein